jgi:hypothetical protein
MTPGDDRAAVPIVVAGMHRSGTSFVASQLAARGVSMGEALLAGDANNPRGYFEDVQFLDLQRRMLVEATPPDDGGHRDWGWTESERLDRGRFGAWRPAALELLAAGRAGGAPWGWKDPRTSLLLDFWLELAPDARFLFVYRPPWEVADSMQRLGAEVFLSRPDYAYRIWLFYNREILSFLERHGDRSLLVSSVAVMDDPTRLEALLASRWGLGLERPTGGAPERDLFRTLPADDPLVELASATHPEAAALLAELDASAHLAGEPRPSVAPVRRWREPGSEPTPRIAVIIPCHDLGEQLVEAVASAERSIAEPYELVVVDDGSKQARTVEVLAQLEGRGVPVVRQENRGLAATRNRGFELTRAPLVFPLDADNRLLPGFVGPALEAFEADAGAGVVYGDRLEIGLRSGRIRVPDVTETTLLAGNVVDACALVRREVWQQAGGFDASMPQHGWEDWDLWLGSLEIGWRMKHLPIPAFEYRVRPGSMITAFNDHTVRLRVLDHIAKKHPVLFERGLAHLIFAAQRYAEDLYQHARRADELTAELHGSRRTFAEGQETLRGARAKVAALRAEAAAARSEAADLGARSIELQSRLDASAAQVRGLREEYDRAATELDRLRWFASDVESTRAWRWRGRLLRGRQALRRWFGRRPRSAAGDEGRGSSRR